MVLFQGRRADRAADVRGFENPCDRRAHSSAQRHGVDRRHGNLKARRGNRRALRTSRCGGFDPADHGRDAGPASIGKRGCGCQCEIPKRRVAGHRSGLVFFWFDRPRIRLRGRPSAGGSLRQGLRAVPHRHSNSGVCSHDRARLEAPHQCRDEPMVVSGKFCAHAQSVGLLPDGCLPPGYAY